MLIKCRKKNNLDANAPVKETLKYDEYEVYTLKTLLDKHAILSTSSEANAQWCH